MNCLLCHMSLSAPLYFYRLFLLSPERQGLCFSCQSQFQLITPPCCPRCSKSGVKGICSDCQLWEKNGIIVNHRAVFVYNEAMEEYFSRYKFMGDYRLRWAFSTYFKQEKGYTLVPIPISESRFQERGFNQVTGFMSHLNFSPLLEKTDGKTQSKLSRNERLKNKNTFALKAKANVPEKILLIDDIYTTGSTLQQASKILKQAGAKEIKSFSLCR